MAKPNKATQKAFAVASTIGAVLKSNQNGEPKLLALQLQVNKAMKVFSRKAGPKIYWAISNEVANIWEIIAERHQNEIKEEEVPKFIEYLCMLIPPNDFKTFLVVSPYRTNIEIRPEVNARIIESILLLDEKLNELIGTSAYTLTKPKEKVVKEKKQRDKSKKKTTAASRLTRKQEKERQRHSNAKSFLQQRIEAARAKKETT